MSARENSRDRWTRHTRESVLRAMVAEHGVPMSAQALVDNLDVGEYTSIGFVGVRSQREVSNALRWHVRQGNLQELPEHERDPYDPPGKLYVLTAEGQSNVVPKEQS